MRDCEVDDAMGDGEVDSPVVDGTAFRERVSVVAGLRTTVDPDEFRTIRSAVDAGNDWYVRAVVRDADRIAYVENRWSDGWVLPGGGIEAGESPAEAAEREVAEETGLAVEGIRPIGCVEQRFISAAPDAAATAHMAVFAARATDSTFGEELGETPDEIEAAAWFDEVPDRVDGVAPDLLGVLMDEASSVLDG